MFCKFRPIRAFIKITYWVLPNTYTNISILILITSWILIVFTLMELRKDSFVQRLNNTEYFHPHTRARAIT